LREDVMSDIFTNSLPNTEPNTESLGGFTDRGEVLKDALAAGITNAEYYS
jgi:hypothetical protein